MFYQPLLQGEDGIPFLMNPQTSQKVTIPKDILSLSLTQTDTYM